MDKFIPFGRGKVLFGATRTTLGFDRSPDAWMPLFVFSLATVVFGLVVDIRFMAHLLAVRFVGIGLSPLFVSGYFPSGPAVFTPRPELYGSMTSSFRKLRCRLDELAAS